ncbi:hypothetical protein POPTR_006G239650v4 [Populus trichocarpa]|uniref:Uncharacterized protein n=1 Tax=Populus trichocarpa TaxID=3694 RepID=A0A3N7FBB6_POPTR|nr:hypothetical protein POPTR_006G239650v4 [Populus trichocarpa]
MRLFSGSACSRLKERQLGLSAVWVAERGSLVSLPREGRRLQQGTRDPCVASGFGSQKSQWQGGGSSGGELGKKWLWERKSPKLSFGSGNSGSLFFKRHPAVAAPQGGFRFFSFQRRRGGSNR